MPRLKLLDWILRISVAGEFLGHGVFALQGKAQWMLWIQDFLGVDASMAVNLLYCVGVMDVVLACIVILRPTSPVLMWCAIWGFWTALVRPLLGEPWMDFVERWANWGAPLALFFIRLEAERALGINQERSDSEGELHEGR